MLRVEIIGTLDNQRHYDLETIKGLLLLDSEMLKMGHDFVGRPGTRIHAGLHDVIKIRTELNFNHEQSQRWIKQTLEKEQQLAVHHPHKTWLLIAEQLDTTEHIAIASICPRLKPLHLELQAKPANNEQRQRYLALLTNVFRMYLTVAKQRHYKLDEGLSNFAVSDDDTVFYLDDEYYQWDNFVSFATMLGVYIRTLDWLDTDFIQDLGQVLIALLDSIFQDSHCCVIIAKQLQGLFMPQGHKEQLLQQLMQLLLPTKHVVAKTPISKTTSQPNHRYFALLADIHANYSALEVVLDYLDSQNIQQGIVLGDIVGYNAEPKECIERLQQTQLHIIKGNHDHAVAINDTSRGFSETAKTAVQWTISQLSAEHREWLKNLPAFEETDDWLAVHGAPIDPAFFYGYVYMMTYEDNLNYLQSKNIRLCFHGHSHLAGAFVRDKRLADHFITDPSLALSQYNQLLVCPGSVGQPRNGCPDAQFAIYDIEQQQINFLTLPYNIQRTVEKMRANNLPEALCQRLLLGK